MLASDLNNPEFTGAQNPDSLVQVEFYNYAALDTWKTNETGIKSYKDECPYIRISIPGNQNSIIERPATGSDTKRWPRQWLVFQMQTGMIANAENVPGWQLDEWSELGQEQVRQLKFLRFYTVEQIAGASDAQIQGIGMGGQGLREKAKRALAEKNGAAVNQEVKARDEKIEALAAENAEIKEKLNRVLEMMSAGQAEPARRGRKPKQEVEA